MTCLARHRYCVRLVSAVAARGDWASYSACLLVARLVTPLRLLSLPFAALLHGWQRASNTNTLASTMFARPGPPSPCSAADVTTRRQSECDCTNESSGKRTRIGARPQWTSTTCHWRGHCPPTQSDARGQQILHRSHHANHRHRHQPDQLSIHSCGQRNQCW